MPRSFFPSEDSTIASRRTVVAGLATMMSGCGLGSFSDSGSSPAANEATTTAPAPATAREVVTTTPTCGETNADQLLTVIPQGVVFIVQARSDAQALRETILNDDTKGAQRGDIRLVPFPDSEQVAVELDDTEFAAYTEFQTEPGVESARNGRSLPTVTKVATQYRSQIQASDAISPTTISTTYVRPEPPAPIQATLALTGVGDTSVLERLVTFEVRVAGPDGEQTVLTGSDITNPTTESRDGRIRIVMTVVEGARERFVQALQDAEALSGGNDRPLHVYSNGEQITKLGLSPNLVQTMQAGEWQGGLVIQVASQETADEVATALGLVSVGLKTTTRLSICG